MSDIVKERARVVFETALEAWKVKAAIDQAVLGNVYEASIPYAMALIEQRATEFLVRRPEDSELLHEIRVQVEVFAKEAGDAYRGNIERN
jgi:DNA primase large subunit